MKLLCDTHVWLWSLLEPSRLRKSACEALRNPENELWLSPISAWEAVMLIEKNRLKLQVAREPTEWVREALARSPFIEAPLTFQSAIGSRELSLPHSDPADRFIAATALHWEMTLVTADKKLLACRQLSTLRAG